MNLGSFLRNACRQETRCQKNDDPVGLRFLHGWHARKLQSAVSRSVSVKPGPKDSVCLFLFIEFLRLKVLK